MKEKIYIDKTENHKIILGDCVEELKKIPSGSVELIFADPPYNIGKKFGNNKDWWPSIDSYTDWCKIWINECIRILKKNGSIYIMGHPKHIPYIMKILDEKLHYGNMIIYHYTDGMPEKKYFDKRYECILYYRKNSNNFIFNLDDVRVEPTRYDKYSNPKGKNPGDVWQIPRVRWNSKERASLGNGKIAHGAQKPLKLLKRIILASSNKNNTVLDPFLGTGTTSVAAKELDRKSIGVEINPEYFNISIKRLEELDKKNEKTSVKFDPKKIHRNIKTIEDFYNKLDEWVIPRDRESFYLTHDFHSYFAAFPPKLAMKIIERYSKEGDVILDPFMGGGSAIIESFIMNRKAIGIDISSFSKAVTKVKVTPIKINEKEIQQILSKIKNEIINCNLFGYKNFNYKIIPINNVDFWFTGKAKYDLSIINNYINKIKNNKLRDFLKLALSAIIRKASNARNAEQHLSIKRYKKIPEVYPLFEKKVKLMTEQMKEYYKLIKSKPKVYKPKLYIYDARKISHRLGDESVDLIITSPPYGTGSKYTQVHKLSFEVLELKKPSIKATLETSKNFHEEMEICLKEMYKVLKKNKYCCIVYGDPSTEGITKKLIRDAKNIGFEYIGLISCPIEKFKSNHHVKYRRFIPKDFVLIFKKL